LRHLQAEKVFFLSFHADAAAAAWIWLMLAHAGRWPRSATLKSKQNLSFFFSLLLSHKTRGGGFSGRWRWPAAARLARLALALATVVALLIFRSSDPLLLLLVFVTFSYRLH
jgi:hypothetical protein